MNDFVFASTVKAGRISDNSLLRPGYPTRIDPYSYHVKKNPAMLDRQLAEAL